MHTRQKLIMEMLRRSGRIGVPEMTLRRDLRADLKNPDPAVYFMTA